MWKQEFIETSRGRFEIFIKGDGIPLCVTHLYSEFNQLGNRFADVFTDYFTVYLINLKDCGNSCKAISENELGMKETVEDLEEIRKNLNLEKWSFAGYSAGGMLGLYYVTRHPESITKLLVGGASASKDYAKNEKCIYSSKNALNKKLLEQITILNNPQSSKEERIKAKRVWEEMSLFRPENLDSYFSKPNSGKTVSNRLEYFSKTDIANYNIKRDLINVFTPTFVCCGKFDTQCPMEFSIEIHNLLPNSRIFIFEESNHYPYIEEEQIFREMVIEFATLSYF